QYDRSGTIEVALEADEAARHRATATALQHAGVDARWLDADQLPAAEPLASTGAQGGLFIATHGFVGVPDLTEALATAAVRAGVQFTLNMRVIAIAPSGDGRASVRTEDGTVTADCVVLAAGSWAGQIAVEGVEPLPVK